MRLGAQAVELAEGTRAREIYGEATIHERHRHRYEVNNQFREQLVEHGLVVSGTFQEGRLVEIVELPDHPWFVASQFHPEFKSRPTRPAPLFREFVGAALDRARRERASAPRPRALTRQQPLTSPLLDLFLELCAIPSPPGRGARGGRPRAARARPARARVGRGRRRRAARLDDRATSSAVCPADARAARRSSSARISTPFPPTAPIEPVVEDGVVRNAGGDDPRRRQQGGRRRRCSRRPGGSSRRGGRTRAIELLFTPKEEIGLLGAYAFDHTRLEAELGFVYDQAAPIGEIILGAPSAQARSRCASTAAPRTRGCTPRRAARRSRPPRARSPTCGSAGSTSETTANVGADRRRDGAQHRARVVRRSTPRRARTTRRTLADARAGDARRVRVRGRRRRLHGRDDGRATSTAATAFGERRRSRCGSRPTGSRARGYRAVGSRSPAAAADANVFNERGLPCVNLANGMARHPHAGRAHRRRRPRADGRRDARARRRGAAARPDADRRCAGGRSPRSPSGTTASSGSRSTAAVRRLPAADGRRSRSGDDGARQRPGASSSGSARAASTSSYANLTRGPRAARGGARRARDEAARTRRCSTRSRFAEEERRAARAGSTACRSSAAACTARSRRSARGSAGRAGRLRPGRRRRAAGLALRHASRAPARGGSLEIDDRRRRRASTATSQCVSTAVGARSCAAGQRCRRRSSARSAPASSARARASGTAGSRSRRRRTRPSRSAARRSSRRRVSERRPARAPPRRSRTTRGPCSRSASASVDGRVAGRARRRRRARGRRGGRRGRAGRTAARALPLSHMGRGAGRRSLVLRAAYAPGDRARSRRSERSPRRVPCTSRPPRRVATAMRSPRAMRIGVAREIKPQRVPRRAHARGRASSSSQRGHEVVVETGAGRRQRASPTRRTRPSARASRRSTTSGRPPSSSSRSRSRSPAEYGRLRDGPDALHVPAPRRRRAADARARRARAITAIAYETVETDDRRLPLLAPMSEVAGRLAPQMGAWALEKAHGGRGILLGGVPGRAARRRWSSSAAASSATTPRSSRSACRPTCGSSTRRSSGCATSRSMLDGRVTLAMSNRLQIEEVDRRRRPRHRRRARPGRARAEARHARDARR